MNAALLTTVQRFTDHGREFTASVLVNPDCNSDFPSTTYPALVFIRDVANPIASGWRFFTSEIEAVYWARDYVQACQRGVTLRATGGKAGVP